MTIRIRTAAIFLAAAVVLTGCTPAESAPAPTSTPVESDHDHPHGDHDELVPAPTASPDHAGAASAATDALRAFVSRDLDYTAWFEQLKPFLHESAVTAYETVNPSRIPAMKVLDGAETTETSTDTYAVVYVPTSLGDYTIELRRDDAAGSWGVTRFQPPA